MLLLAGLVVAFHVGREERGEGNRADDRVKRKRRARISPNTWTDPRCDFIRPGLTGSVIRRTRCLRDWLEIMITPALAFVVAGATGARPMVR